ncbi:putative Transcriptional regulator, AraC family [Thiomonas arsenitoxydans]|uniref:Transcriptional regulator, AraC family n=2 Tax=Thiomonas arsenitoxydans (strain DSM 22701 / CIP 110005 / 3As) TaxID=426114 RepID=D6CKX8_THIA3|nr:AraC family transcriptional regulator [Thiomonas arsenitoxydans]CAZ87731.1 putative Transcriptional regulator, AraC family [Thiomonas arsenitoxydans]CQR26743.1 putative Transcriptional regulator, AraC family [Thiomonas arsenitoxydans]CQR30661.1 putative Transcriptional regulator, AraC family [Thiomonas arsenitoxydans]CQR30684.1 putative Transcriptional regulator, AraC family [Thiomonas arsenitoxydans]CQR31920.1 putative Transcriptional regulator, AraC family [Thiomonas arsenitoxydans]
MARNQSIKIIPCEMRGTQAIVADSSITFGRHTHEQFGIGLMDRGGHKSASGRGLVEAWPGDVITVNPGEVHDGAPIGCTSRSWRMLYFEPSIIAEAAEDIAEGGRLKGEFASPVVRDGQQASAVRRLFDVATSTAPNSLQQDEALLSALGPLLQPIQPRLSGFPAAIHSARAMMDDDPATAVPLPVLAHEAGLSQYQFLRAFTRMTGLPPHAYLVQRRIHLARTLLRRGMKPAEAAAACGFADQSHMTRLFVRTFGLAPGAYTKALG